MAAESKQGPVFVTGDMQTIPAAYGSQVSDPNSDRGPSMIFMGWFLGDVRFPFPKDKVEGYTGNVPGIAQTPDFAMVDQIPAAVQTNNIAAAQTVAAGVPMALVTALSTGITPNIPVRLNTQGAFGLNGGAVTPAIALDFGFAFGNVTAGQANVTVADSTQFIVGQPLVIGGVGNAQGTLPLLTAVQSINTATQISLVANALPLGTNATAPIGTGNYWGPSPAGYPGQSPNGLPLPDAALPYIAQGPGLLLDVRQSVTRGVQINGASGGTGGTFAVVGIDIYNVLVHENIAVGAGASTGWGQKTYKYILSVTPQFADAHNYTVGTSDVFGAAIRGDEFEYQTIFWAGAADTQTQANSGWTAAVTTNPATATTGDVRGTFQSGTNGGGSGLSGGSASNGTISNLAMSGRRLVWASQPRLYNIFNATVANPQYFYGVAQF